MPDSRKGRAWFPTLAALFALLVLAPQAAATGTEHEPEHAGEVPVGLFIKEADAERGKVLAQIRCTGTSKDGYVVGLAVSPAVDMASLAPGSEVGVLLDVSTDPKTIVKVLEDDCPTPEPKPESGYPKPDREPPVDSCEDHSPVRAAHTNRDEEEEAAPDEGCLPQFVRGFLTRVWKFIGEVDYYETGEMGMTLGRILNLPRKFRSQDDELLDQDTTVLVSNRARVFENGERVSRDRLAAANGVRVHGKLLRPGQWREDEDGSPVPTIRAKKVYITG